MLEKLYPYELDFQIFRYYTLIISCIVLLILVNLIVLLPIALESLHAGKDLRLISFMVV